MKSDDLCVAQVASVTGQTLIPLGVLADQPLTWWRSPTGGKLHVNDLCGSPRVDRVSVDMPLADLDAGQLCQVCLHKAPRATISAVRTTLDALDAHALYTRRVDVESPRWDDLRDAHGALNELASIGANHYRPEVAATIADLVSAGRARLEVLRAACVEADPGFPLQLAAAGLIDRDRSDNAVADELGMKADRLFSSAVGSNQWTFLAADGYVSFMTAIRNGRGPDAADPAGRNRMARELERDQYRFRRGDDPVRLAFSGADFASPTEWSDAEHLHARQRATDTLLADWQAQIGEMLAEDRTPVLAKVAAYAGRNSDYEADAADRSQLLACYQRAKLDGGERLIVAPPLVARRFGMVWVPRTTHWRTDREIDTSGPLQAGDTDETIGLACQLIADGLSCADALDAARALTAGRQPAPA